MSEVLLNKQIFIIYCTAFETENLLVFLSTKSLAMICSSHVFTKNEFRIYKRLVLCFIVFLVKTIWCAKSRLNLKRFLFLIWSHPQKDVPNHYLNFFTSAKFRKHTVKPWILPKKPYEWIRFYYYATCFRSFFGRDWRHQKTIRNYPTFRIGWKVEDSDLAHIFECWDQSKNSFWDWATFKKDSL